MQRIQPFYYIVAMAGIIFLAGLVLFSLQMMPVAESTAVAVDPQSEIESDTLYDLWFTSVGIYDLQVDHALSRILFSAENNTVNLLDRDRKLLWEKVFATAPHEAKISSCGGYVVVGTAGGRIFFSSTDQQITWDNEGDSIDLLEISPSASWIAAARSASDGENHHLDLFDQSGQLQWSLETGPVLNLYISSEYLEQVHVYYTELVDEMPVIKAVNLEGEEVWSYENQSLVAVSRHGSRLAAVQEKRLIVYDSLGYSLWNSALPFTAETVLFNPQNYNRVLIYGTPEGTGENLYYFDLAEDLIWMKRIADGSLFSFTADGQHILTSSWRHFKEDYTQMVLLNRDGREVNSWEVAMQVEHLSMSGHPHLVAVAGSDGYIDLINLEQRLIYNGDSVIEGPVYSPVMAGQVEAQPRVIIYFRDESDHLIPVSRPVSLSENPMGDAMNELVRGPARNSQLYRSIPDKNISIEVEYAQAERAVYLELSPELLDLNGSFQSEAVLKAILMTVSEFPSIGDIYFTVNRRPLERFGDILLDQPLQPIDYFQPLFTPVRSGNRYYLTVSEGMSEERGEISLEELVRQVLRVSRALPFVPDDLELLNLNVSAERIVLNMNESFMGLFPEASEETDVLHSLMVLDALFMTLFENSNRLRAEIYVNGDVWTPPEGYPPLGRFFRQPYYINPE